MAVLRKQFHAHENGAHDETWHYLARDTETGRVFVIKDWCLGERGRFQEGSTEIELGAFLTNVDATAKSNLVRLIGSLVPDGNA